MDPAAAGPASDDEEEAFIGLEEGNIIDGEVLDDLDDNDCQSEAPGLRTRSLPGTWIAQPWLG